MPVFTQQLGSLLTAVQLDAPKVTATLDMSRTSELLLQCRLTRVAATAVIVTVEESEDGVIWSDVQAEAAGALTPLTLTRTTSVTENFSFKLDVSMFQNVRITFTATAGGVTDLLTVLGRVGSGV